MITPFSVIAKNLATKGWEKVEIEVVVRVDKAGECNGVVKRYIEVLNFAVRRCRADVRYLSVANPDVYRRVGPQYINVMQDHYPLLKCIP